MGVAHDLGKALGHAIEPLRAGDEKLVAVRLGLDESTRTIDVTSTSFTDGGPLPVELTADGAGVSPPLAWSNVPKAARSLVLIAEDPDAPFPNPFVHWMVYGLGPTDTALFEVHGHHVHEGKNSNLGIGYAPAAPPAGHGTHHYHFQLFALDTALDLEEGAGRTSLVEALRTHVMAWGEIVGTYERS